MTERTALRGRAAVRVDPTLVEIGGLASPLLDSLGESRGRYVCDALVTAERQRITYGPKGKEFTVVYEGTKGLTFWDHVTRTFARIGEDELPRTRIEPPRSIEVVTHESSEEATFVVSVDDPSVGRIRHEITVARREEWASFGPALMRVLHCGPVCHAHSGLPWEQIASAGLIIREKTFAAEGGEPISEMEIESIDVVEIAADDFIPPRQFRPLQELLRKPDDPLSPTESDDAAAAEAQKGTIKQALEDAPGGAPRAFDIIDNLTPDCMGSTRFGSMTASIHQDLLTVAANAINIAAPLIGPTSIGNGSWTIPWLANLAAVNAASATAPGSGIFCFLRAPRNPMLPPGPAGGGLGLLDRFAFSSLYQRDSTGTMRTQRESTAGTLAATLAGWRVGAPADANLIAASGDLTMISLLDQRTITEAYELAELGTLRVTGLPTTFQSFTFGSLSLGSISTPPLFTLTVGVLTGTVNFASLAGAPVITTASIGNSGNFVLGVRLPAVALSGIVARSPTPFGLFVLSTGTLGFCLAMPLLCPLAVTLAVLASFISANITAVSASMTGVTWTLDVSFAFDPATERVEPFVTVVGRTGAVRVGAFGVTPNLIANVVDALVARFGTLFDQFGALLAQQGANALQAGLRALGLHLPVANDQNELRAVSGEARSTTGGILQLSADVRPIDNVSSQPFTTQVPRRADLRAQILLPHASFQRDLNPQPVPPAPPAPGPGPVVSVGTFLGLGVSQNALNHYIFHQWVQHRFEVTVTDPALITGVVNAAPGLFVRSPTQIHLWCASPPRVEIAPGELATGARPLVAYFDDVRACFELQSGTDGAARPLWELSCNFKTSATIQVAWPWVFSLHLDPLRVAPTLYEPRTWEFVDPNIPNIMGTLAPARLARIVEMIGDLLIAPVSTVGIVPPIGARAWNRPLPTIQQAIFPPIMPGSPLQPQQAYLELFARRKTLYALAAIDTALLELIDGSGAVFLNTIVLPLAGAPGPLPTTLARMTCLQGAALRNFILPRIGMPTGP
jgi:hypothetical protein